MLAYGLSPSWGIGRRQWSSKAPGPVHWSLFCSRCNPSSSYLLVSHFFRCFAVSLFFPLALRFHFSPCLVVLFSAFLRVCPIHRHLLLPISSSAVACFVLLHNSLLLIVLDQWMLIILCKHLLVNGWSLQIVVVVNLQVSEPYNSTDLTFVEDRLSAVSKNFGTPDVFKL